MQRSICYQRILNFSAHACINTAPVLPTHPKFEDVRCFTKIVLAWEEFMKERHILDLVLASNLLSIFRIMSQDCIYQNLGVSLFWVLPGFNWAPFNFQIPKVLIYCGNGRGYVILNPSISDVRASNSVGVTFNILHKYFPDVTGAAQIWGQLLSTAAPSLTSSTPWFYALLSSLLLSLSFLLMLLILPFLPSPFTSVMPRYFD